MSTECWESTLNLGTQSPVATAPTGLSGATKAAAAAHPPVSCHLNLTSCLSHWMSSHRLSLSFLTQHVATLFICPCCLQGVELLSGLNKDVGPWALHLLPGPATSAKAAAAVKLHHLGMRLQDGQQLVQLKQLMVQALMETARRQG